ncbi:hypothetical protein [Streptomyces caniscabiei]|uniref:Uncharacterized protein n=1 Tax=Streptomyces caniscabiei TaxID=2746961 RepID=A0ABU4MYU8_9ACTN|nr:hypothetical protein [Streptomyces caniscabiei]MBE4790279.1 hypothetical protein [Streptomyces caniscabiei]MBE4799492.1 hypothetical protein [Streptomyces caniscabiei]MDX3015136.1 hypothetical protein [Streptomyces caniscabiei]MDX3042579.1 hypothetical protein [Streptomyces caniscabiei]
MKGQLELDVMQPADEPGPEVRVYFECRGPKDWRPVTVRVRYGNVAGLEDPVLPLVQTVALAPRNVLVERDDGTSDVRPVRLLRCSRPGERP